MKHGVKLGQGNAPHSPVLPGVFQGGERPTFKKKISSSNPNLNTKIYKQEHHDGIMCDKHNLQLSKIVKKRKIEEASHAVEPAQKSDRLCRARLREEFGFSMLFGTLVYAELSPALSRDLEPKLVKQEM